MSTISVEPETILEAKKLIDEIKAASSRSVQPSSITITSTLRKSDVISLSQKIDNLAKSCRRSADVREGSPL